MWGYGRGSSSCASHSLCGESVTVRGESEWISSLLQECVYILQPLINIQEWKLYVVWACPKRQSVCTAHVATHTTNGWGQDIIRGWLTSSGNNVTQVCVCIWGNVYLSVCFSVFNIPGCSFLGNTARSRWGAHWGLLVSMLSTPKHTPKPPAPLIPLHIFSSPPFSLLSLSVPPPPPPHVLKVSADNSLPYLESFFIPCRSF